MTGCAGLINTPCGIYWKTFRGSFFLDSIFGFVKMRAYGVMHIRLQGASIKNS